MNYTLAMLVALVLMGYVMKAIGLASHGFAYARLGDYFASPMLTVRSFEASEGSRPAKAPTRYAFELCLQLAVVLSSWWLVGVLKNEGFRWWQLSYVLIPGALSVFLALGSAIGCVTTLAGRPVPTMIEPPWSARHVTQMWAHRWNRWISEWHREVVFDRFGNPRVAAFMVFLVSGFWHDLIISGTYYVFTGNRVFGWATAYFMIQFVACIVDQAALKRRPQWRRPFMWLSVIGPCPLFLNPGFLLAFGVSA